MLLKYKLLIAFFISLTLTAWSQVPGYMGKRLAIGYSNNFFLAGVGPTASSYDVGLNSTHSFNLEYTIKNRTNLCGSFQIFKTGLAMNRTFYGNNYNPSFGTYDSHYYTYAPNPAIPMELKSKCVAVGLKFFQRGYLAPVGKYRKFELVIMFSNLSYGDDSFIYVDGGSLAYASLGTGEYAFKEFALMYTLGRQRILFNRVVLDYGMQFGFMPAVLPSVLLSDGNSVYYNSISFETALRQDVNFRLFRHQLCNFHLGLSFLAI